MWTRLIEIVELKWRHSPQPRERLAKGAAVLYGAMTNCREAFLNFKRDQSEAAFWNFLFSIEALLSILVNLNSGFRIFDHDARALLEAHLRRAAEQRLPAIPSERARAQIKLLRELVDREFEAMDAGTEMLGEFDDALDMLANFMRAHYTLEDVLSGNALSTAGSEDRHAAPALRVR